MSYLLLLFIYFHTKTQKQLIDHLSILIFVIFFLSVKFKIFHEFLFKKNIFLKVFRRNILQIPKEIVHFIKLSMINRQSLNSNTNSQIWTMIQKPYKAQQSLEAEVIYHNILQYGSNLRLQRDLFSNEIATKLEKIFKKQRQSSQVIFYAEFGAAVLLHRQSMEDPISFKMVFPIAWNMSSDIEQKYIFASNPQNFTDFNLGTLQQTNYSLKQVKQKFNQWLNICKKLAQEKSSEFKIKKNHHTPSWLREVAIIAMSKFEQNLRKEGIQTFPNKDIFSKGGTLDVGLHTGTTIPTTTYPLAIALIRYYLKNQSFAKVFELSYRLNLLLKVKYENKKFDSENHQFMMEVRKDISQLKKTEHLSSIMDEKKSKILIEKLLCKSNQKIDPPTDFEIPTSIQRNKFSICLFKEESTRESLSYNSSGIFNKQNSTKNTNIFELQPKEGLFSNLLQLYRCIQAEKWVLLVERTMFSLAINYIETEKILPFGINEITLPHTYLRKVCDKYKLLLTTSSCYYGMGLKSVAESHKMLVQIISMIIAFEVVKYDRRNKIGKLQGYRIPYNDIQQFYQLFSSFSFQARRAMESVRKYLTRNRNKKQIFHISNSDTYYRGFAMDFSQQKSIQEWIQNKKNDIKNQIQKLKDILQSFHREYKNTKRSLSQYRNQRCSCTTETVERKKNKRKRWEPDIIEYIQVHKECNRCKMMKCKQREVDNLQSKRYPCIITEIPDKDIQIFAFLCHIPSEIQAMIQIFMQLYPVKQNCHRRYGNFFQSNKITYGQIVPYAKETNGQYFTAYTCQPSMAHVNVRYQSSNTHILWKDQSQMESLDQNLFLYQGKSQLVSIISKPPESDKQLSKVSLRREHQIYTFFPICKKQGLKPEQMISFSEVRVALRTQISVLAASLLDRKITLDVVDEKSRNLGWQVVARTVSNLYSLKHDCPQSQLMSQHSLNLLLDHYCDNWNYTQINSLTIVGPLMSIYEKQINYKGINGSLKLAEKAYEEFLKLNQDLSENANRIQQIRASQSLICFQGICCFTENNLTISSPQNILFAFFLIMQRACQVYIGDKGNKGHKNFISAFKFYKKRAKFMNLPTLSNYMANNPKKFKQIIRFIDDDIPENVVWKKLSEKQFTFIGTSWRGEKKIIYEVDVETGIVLKNGRELTGLSKEIKQDKYYRQIFQERDFQVYYNDFGAARIKRGYQNVLGYDKNQKVFFEFGLNNNKTQDFQKVTIKMVYQQKKTDNSQFFQEEEEWQLIQRQKLSKFNFEIPELYLHGCLAWVSHKKKCIVFRNPKLQKAKNCEMIIHYDINGRLLHGFIIKNQFKDKSLAILCDLNHSLQSFEEILFKEKGKKITNFTKIEQILETIEDRRYIIPLKNEGNCEIYKFWLHRYGLNVQLSKDGLLIQGYSGYKISLCPQTKSFIPWSIKDNVRCLVLEKYIKNSILMVMQPSTKVLIPDIPIMHGQKSRNQNMPLPNGHSTKISLFQYDIHEHFKDIRGKNRLAQLHLATLMISLNKCSSLQKICLTSNQYCMRILRSCYGNRPLDPKEKKKLLQLLKYARTNKNCAVLLCCEAFIIMTTGLKGVIFEGDKNTNYLKQELTGQQEYLDFARIKYQQIEDYLPSEEKLNHLEKTLLNFSDVVINNSNEQKTLNQLEWAKKFPLFIGEKQKDSFQQNYRKIRDIFMDNIEYLQKEYKSILSRKPVVFNGIYISEETNVQRLIDMKIVKDKGQLMVQELLKQQSQSFQSHKKDQEIEKGMNIDALHVRSIMAKLIFKLNKNKNQIEEFINKLSQHSLSNIEISTSLRPCITPLRYVEILCNQELIKEFLPEISTKDASMIIDVIKLWVVNTIELDSIYRIQSLYSYGIKDQKMIRREIQSPRRKIIQRPSWICFEAEMRIKIWASQYQTYCDLTDQNRNRAISQLNMGEGKTQVIIPMFVLELLYGNQEKRRLPRITFLSSLLRESRANYFRFFSATNFRIPTVEIPFNRTIQLSEINIRRIYRFIKVFLPRCLIIWDRESCLSMILKIREHRSICFEKNETSSILLKKQRDEWLFGSEKVFDIFDEADALMTPKKSFIYAVGGSSDLPEASLRIQICRYLLQIFTKQMLSQCEQRGILVCQSQENMVKAPIQGFYPNIRLLIEKKQKDLIWFRRRLVDLFLGKKYLPNNFSFFQKIQEQSEETAENLKFYLIIEEKTPGRIEQSPLIPKSAWQQIYCLRGLIAYGILEHCLSHRCGVDFGVPGSDHPKQVAVPYEAADVPSKRSQYAHPDVATIFSFVAYYNKGMTIQQMNDALKKLFELTESARRFCYKQWLQAICPLKRKELNREDVSKINLKSTSQIQDLYRVFSHCRPTIAFWLIKIVFPSDLRQFKSSITSSSWDIADAKQSIGFSGTKDNRWVFPPQLSWIPSEDYQIRGTDGRNLDFIMQFTKDVIQIPPEHGNTEKYLWKRFIRKAIQENLTCIIDAGAILVGQSLKNQIVPWVAKILIQRKTCLKGITFPNDDGHWEVYNLFTQCFIEKGSSIPEHQTFVIFDEARTRGADIKMDSNVCAALTLAPNMPKDKAMQAVGRLRKFGRNQTIKFLATAQIFSKIEGFNMSQKLQDRIKAILRWVISNSISENKKLTYPNNKLGWIHVQSKHNQGRSYVQTFQPELDVMYRRQLLMKTPLSMHEETQEDVLKRNKEAALDEVMKIQSQNMKKYGANFLIRAQGLDDICEREVEMVEEVQKEVERQQCVLSAIPQNQQFMTVSESQMSRFPFSFSNKFKISQNFYSCTKELQSSHSYYQNSGYFVTKKISIKDEFNELMNANFVLLTTDSLCLITMAETNRFLKNKTPFLDNVTKMLKYHQFIARLNDLKPSLLTHRFKGMCPVFLQAQFFNGKQIFSKEYNGETESQFQIVRKMLKTTKQKYSTHWNKNLEDMVAYFLHKRRTFNSKYLLSSLQQILTSLNNDCI